MTQNDIKYKTRKLDIKLHGQETLRFCINIPTNLNDEDIKMLVSNSVGDLEVEINNLSKLSEKFKKVNKN